jgi:hypothetical protein
LQRQQLLGVQTPDPSSRWHKPCSPPCELLLLLLAGRIVLYHALVFFLWAEYATLKTRYRSAGDAVHTSSEQPLPG